MKLFGVESILVLSPHKDDEVLGCGGTLLQHFGTTHVLYFNTIHPNVNQTVYDAECKAVVEMLKATCSFAMYSKTNALESFPISRHVTEIETTIKLFKPETILIPFPSYNQDHRRVFEAAITASRIHDINPLVNNVLVYEQPETIQTNRISPQFVPNVFVPIDIDKKIALYELYASQVREHRSKDHLRFLAGVRGMQAGVPYAEAFMALRIII